ncbi:MAG: type I glyceraldehyde-3-phosphate dehydrogenase [Candidatus Eisenbacteria bacterium]|nr:type I glyceraldehyde-3-phosphate dehydrogenase [Candidatus Eisenbacteria bacterium]
MARIAVNGMGRIGRALVKMVLDEPSLELVAMNDLVSAENIAYLLRYDTVYGRFDRPVEHGDKELVIEGTSYPLHSEKDPAELPWKELNVDIVFESTGVFTKREDLEKHIEAGARHALLSAPSKSEDVTTIVHGVNTPEGKPQIMSCASCTTNCITPVVEVMGRRIGFTKAIMTTIHAYTASQGIVDGPHKKMRRGRAGAANFVPTSTGAAIAATKALPQYEGLFDGVAVRAPIPVGSIADLVFLTGRKTTAEEVNDAFREEAASDRYLGILGASDDELVSSDIVGDDRASIVDLGMTRVVDGDLVKIMAWYDNEWGYARQMIREAVRIAGS